MSRTAPSWPRLSEVGRGVLLELLVHGTKSRSELADRLRLSRPTLPRVTNDHYHHPRRADPTRSGTAASSIGRMSRCG
ncbi:hypothetical protein AB0H12_32445 [Actinosynnema sp. NPDC023794]